MSAPKLVPILVAQLGPRFAAPPSFDVILKDGRKGRKNVVFTFYPAENKGVFWKRKQEKQVDTSVYVLLGVTPKAHFRALGDSTALYYDDVE